MAPTTAQRLGADLLLGLARSTDPSRDPQGLDAALDGLARLADPAVRDRARRALEAVRDLLDAPAADPTLEERVAACFGALWTGTDPEDADDGGASAGAALVAAARDAVAKPDATTAEASPAYTPASFAASGFAAVEPPELPDDLEAELAHEFLVQHDETVETLERAALEFERGVENPDALDAIRRVLHTLKGDSGLIGLTVLERHTHELEDRIEAGTEDLDARLLRFADELRPWMLALKLVDQGIAPADAARRAAVEMQPAQDADPSSRKASPTGLDAAERATLGTKPFELRAEPALLGDFATEALGLLEAAAPCLPRACDEAPEAAETDRAFRAVDAVANHARFLELVPLRELARDTSHVLDSLRRGALEVGADVVDDLETALDTLRSMVDEVRTAADGGRRLLDARPDLPALLERLEAHGATASAPDTTATRDAAPVHAATVDDLAESVAEGALTVLGAAPGADPATSASAPQAAVGASSSPASPTASGSPRTAGNAPGEMIRVDQRRLDRLVDAIGELVIAESMVRECADRRGLGAEERQFSLLGKITRELQDTAMSLRMVPLKSTFHRMARLARDVSKKLDKPIAFHSVGEDAELDKTMVDALADPLMHMVRNAVDHGLESVEARLAAGKPREGSITLRAYCEGGGVYIELEDDGGGMDRDAILAKAVERGIVAPGTELPDAEVFQLVFEPGFSTAARISELSGRGVGLDVVKKSIEALRGSIEIRSRRGEGTTFVLRLPLTLAIIDGMLVRVGDQRFIIPTLDIFWIVQREDAGSTRVFDRDEMFEIGGRMVPVVRVGDVLGLCDAPAPSPGSGALIVVEFGAGQRAALAVDEVLGKQQTVIKSLGPAFADCDGFAGGAMMPDGRVSLILDVASLLASVRSGVPSA